MTIVEQLKSDDAGIRDRALERFNTRRRIQKARMLDDDGFVKSWICGQLAEIGLVWVEYVPEPWWLERIQALQPGDACEFEWPAKPGWRPGRVLENGGSGYWRIKPTSLLDRLSDDRDACVYIEQVRLPNQVEAWPLRRSS